MDLYYNFDDFIYHKEMLFDENESERKCSELLI